MSDQSPQKKICLLPSEGDHAELYVLLVSSFRDAGFEVIVTGDQDIFDRMNALAGPFHAGVRFIPRQEGESDARLLGRLKPEINTSRAVIFDEVFKTAWPLFWGLWRHRLRAKKIFIVHFSNSWFAQPLSLRPGTLFKSIYRKLIVRKMDALVVISPVLRDYIRHVSAYAKDIYVLPFLRPEEEPAPPRQGDVLTIAVPGEINCQRREYMHVLDAFEELWKEYPGRLRLKLIGSACPRPGSQAVVRRCDRLRERFGEDALRYWTRSLSSRDFRAEVMSADMILGNFNIYTEVVDRREIYGLTMDSGLVHHMISFAKPGFLPDAMSMRPGFTEQILRYSDAASLKHVLQALLNGGIDLGALTRAAVENRKRFFEDADAEIARLVGDLERL